MQDVMARLKAANADVEHRDGSLGEELKERRDSARVTHESLRADTESELMVDGQRVAREDFVAETIVLRTGRPVLGILRNQAQLVFDDPESQMWRQRLETARSGLVRAAQAVGRIEVDGHSLAWLGTGWLVDRDIIVTNRHVASEFARRRGGEFVFRQGLHGRPLSASIDFIEELERQDSFAFRLERILHIEDENGPDLAFLGATQVAGQILASPIELASVAIDEDAMVAVIGYPARDSRIADQTLMDRIFGQVYDKKRLAPGQITKADRQTVRHDCSTLGGNSGSVVLSLQTGQAVGLHFAGRFLEANSPWPARS